VAVFTKVSSNDLSVVLENFGLGKLVDLQEISAGIENTNYFLDTRCMGEETKYWVLTLFENIDESELPFFSQFTQHLAHAGLAVPAPLKNEQGDSLFRIKGKSAAIVPRLLGADLSDVDEIACAQVGKWLAYMHHAQTDFGSHRPLVRDLDWMERNYQSLSKSKIGSDLALLRGYINRYKDYRTTLEACPHGTVHGDLFKDNVLFHEGKVSGVIDFYHACHAALLFDLAVTANDWCCLDNGAHDVGRLNALVNAYKGERDWTEIEARAWPYCLEVAALRFWISRLVSKYVGGYQDKSVAGDTIKDPDKMKMILLHLSDAHAPIQI
jgi:homoserine kinase type II